MKRSVTALITAASLSLTACYGSFRITNSVYGWNSEIHDRWGRWLVFLAFVVIPVYPICLLADALVANSIEFWSGKPVALDEDGKARRVVRAGGEEARMTYDPATAVVRIEHRGTVTELRPVGPDRVEVRRGGRVEVWHVVRDGKGLRLLGPSGETRVDADAVARLTGGEGEPYLASAR
jgi:uncharacterized protein DUF3332